MNPNRLIRKVSRDYRDLTAVICGDRELTYGMLGERASRFANALAERGVAQGDRVALLGDNSLESLELLVGCAIGGFVRCSLHAHDVPERHRYLIDHVEASAVVVQAAHYPTLAPHLEGAASVRTVIVIGDVENSGESAVVDYDEMVAAASPEIPEVELAPGDLDVIRFSAGTTGFPKGIMISVAATMGMGDEYAMVLPAMDETDRYLAAGPLTHAAGMFVYAILAAGAATVVMPSFDAEDFLANVQRHRVTSTLVVPTMIQLITEHPRARDYDLSSLRAVMYGAAPISESSLAKAAALWGEVMYQIYGQSEVLPISVLKPSQHRADLGLLTSAGRATPNAWFRVEDEDGVELPRGQVGEVIAGSPCTMSGIWADPAATKQRLTADGGVRTRDMGYVNDDGFLFLADRKEDLINSGGFNIWPAELENALAAHPAVQEVCVVGVPHPKWGESPHAVVVVRDGRAVEPDELIAWSRERVGAKKKVTAVRFADALPKTPLGKILRRRVREEHFPGESGFGRV
ncbi:class I adenylate-forming enzyme family protein [Gordonia hydrophobica]|uniref:AMP-binding protein n=1 Tax=Gordonia hydrophobica TaxID=40516 RepID=A0ABZ2U749_9ACTN|nr:AMP-binding protein [Gordonia hydrophobica]MBM7365337.1 acyl-CoA synthetase (AMP-forming)/AMP-acid ligase II [Gordonia hydrophobica]